MRIDINRINLGYTRSLVKSLFLCEEDYQIFLSDEDAPSPFFLPTYRHVAQKFGPLGVIARANPYPSVWTIPALDRTEVRYEDDEVTVLAPGLYAAHLASFQGVYLGGLCISPAAVKDLHMITLEQGCYPQRFLAANAAFHQGLALVKSGSIGQFPAALASTKNERMTPRKGDWGVAEYIALAHKISYFYDRQGMPKEAYDALIERQLRFAYTRTPIYFQMAAKRGPEAALEFLRSVQESSDAFRRPLFWEYVYTHINGNFDNKTKALFRNCCTRIQDSLSAARFRMRNTYLHNHKGFGYERVKHPFSPFP